MIDNWYYVVFTLAALSGRNLKHTVKVIGMKLVTDLYWLGQKVHRQDFYSSRKSFVN